MNKKGLVLQPGLASSSPILSAEITGFLHYTQSNADDPFGLLQCQCGPSRLRGLSESVSALPSNMASKPIIKMLTPSISLCGHQQFRPINKCFLNCLNLSDILYCQMFYSHLFLRL